VRTFFSFKISVISTEANNLFFRSTSILRGA
jgi:hypothetical protein